MTPEEFRQALRVRQANEEFTIVGHVYTVRDYEREPIYDRVVLYVRILDGEVDVTGTCHPIEPLDLLPVAYVDTMVEIALRRAKGALSPR